MSRLFLGLPVPPETAEGLRGLLRAWTPPGRAVPPANWHVTVVFLGEVGPEAEAVLVAKLQGAALGPRFEATLVGAGAFPAPRSAKVIWMGVSATELSGLHERVRDLAGAKVEPYVPHLTLARQHAPRDEREALAAFPPARLAMPVDRVVLYESAGGQYHVKAFATLA